MPKGVICGGAVDGSNQLGAIVTCQAMTARPDGAGAASLNSVAPKTSIAASSRLKARRQGTLCVEIIRLTSELGSAFPIVRLFRPRRQRWSQLWFSTGVDNWRI